MMSFERVKMRWVKSSFLAGIFMATVLTIALHLSNSKIGLLIVEDEHSHKQNVNNKDDESNCDLFSGIWVLDNVSYPLYEEAKCSFMKNEFACHKFGRNNLKYQQWVWKPRACQLPRFDGRKLLEKIRGKRVVFVGDSLNRNQWTSLLCLVESSLHQSSIKSVVRKHNLFVFHATEYNATIEFYWSPLLVESNVDDPYNHYIRNNLVLRPNSIEKHARHWTHADILIFDSFTWWIKYNFTLLWGSFGSREAIRKVVAKDPRLYEMCLNTWSDWLEFNINRTKTKLFFMSISPMHYNGEQFDGQQCYNETEPTMNEDYWGVQTDREMMRIAESTIDRLERRGLHVQYLNITHLSDFRKDAHSSINKNFSHIKNKDWLLTNYPKAIADCIHWCLPGVPDVWNIILYHYIINS